MFLGVKGLHYQNSVEIVQHRAAYLVRLFTRLMLRDFLYTKGLNMAGLSTHALDTVLGRPAAGLRIDLARINDDVATPLGTTTTNADGRTDGPLLTGEQLTQGEYELMFHIGAYIAATQPNSGGFLDKVPVRFTVSQSGGHYHVPLLFSPFSYSTYRGS